MNTATNTNQIHTATARSARTTPCGFRRRCVAGALMVTTLTATAVGFAATSHADDTPPAPNPGIAAVVPAPAAPWIPPIAAPWIDRFGSYRHLQCGFPGWRGPFQCW